MTTKIKKLYNFFKKGLASCEAESFRSGFVILFAVVISSILLSITLGVANIALKELKFGTSAKETSGAFFAADTGIECALMNDKPPSTSFDPGGGSGTVQCLNTAIAVNGDFASGWDFVVPGLGSTALNCAKVNVTKENFVASDGVTYIRTTIISKGYNLGGNTIDCTSSNPDRIERQLEARY